jgi:hypothetical protein
MDLLFDPTGVESPGVVGAMSEALVSRPTGAWIELLGVRFASGEAFGFASVLRVQALVEGIDRGLGWARLAADLGWSDQAHLTRDLRRIAGVTPSALARSLRAVSTAPAASDPRTGGAASAARIVGRVPE